MATLKPVTPGELLLEEFLIPMDLTRYRVAKEIGVPAQRIGEIVAGKRDYGRYGSKAMPVFRTVERLLASGPGVL